MKVRKKYKDLSEIPENEKEGLVDLNTTAGAVEWLKDDKEYTVYGIMFDLEERSTLYLITSGCSNNHLYCMYSILFEVVDPRFSKHWVGGFRGNYIILSFQELFEDIYFEGSLLEDEEKEVGIFLKYKALMDEEFLEKKPIDWEEVGYNWKPGDPFPEG